MIGPAVDNRKFCKRKFTCADADHTCSDDQFLVAGSFICGVESCTLQQCCLDKQEYCQEILTQEHKCVDYVGICPRDTHKPKSNFDTIWCGQASDICTVEKCCTAYSESLLKQIYVSAIVSQSLECYISRVSNVIIDVYYFQVDTELE